MVRRPLESSREEAIMSGGRVWGMEEEEEEEEEDKAFRDQFVLFGKGGGEEGQYLK